jgi:hypothetical protein
MQPGSAAGSSQEIGVENRTIVNIRLMASHEPYESQIGLTLCNVAFSS